MTSLSTHKVLFMILNEEQLKDLECDIDLLSAKLKKTAYAENYPHCTLLR